MANVGQTLGTNLRHLSIMFDRRKRYPKASLGLHIFSGEAYPKNAHAPRRQALAG